MDIKSQAKISGFFFSGGPLVFRCAVRNVTTFRKVSAFAEQWGLDVAPNTGVFPQLMKLTVKESK